MFKVTVYGSGTSRCRQMRIRVHNALWMLGIRDFEVIVEGDMRKFPEGVTDVPAMGVEGKIISDGRLPEIGEIQRMLQPYVMDMIVPKAA